MSEPIGEHEISEPTDGRNPWLSDKAYTNLEWVARVLLPGTATLYMALAAIWGFPNATQVVGTIVAVDAFLGVFIGLAKKAYDASGAKFNGSVTAIPSDNGTVLTNLVLDKDPSELQQLVLKVQSPPSS
jgi:hypothetical protein